MPPTPCLQLDTMGISNGAVAKETSFSTKEHQKPMPLPANTFAWELNFISFAFLAAAFAMVPQSLRVYFYGYFAIALFDAAAYYHRRGSMAGVPYTLPFVSLVAMIISPVRFWAEQGNIAQESKDGISCNTFAGKFVVYVTDAKLCRQVMTGIEDYDFYAHPNAYWLFTAANFIYKPNDEHKAFRLLLTPALFSDEALELYALTQERVCRRHLQRIAEKCESRDTPVDIRIEFRTMAAAVSQESFMGPYLTDDVKQALEQDILVFTMGFLCFPFPYFNSGLAQAIKAKHRILKIIREVTPRARNNARKNIADAPPKCLLDFWVRSIATKAEEKGVEPNELPDCSDEDLSRAVLDMLFAAQDATNSALTSSVDVLAARPDVVKRVRDEVNSVPSGPETSLWRRVRDNGDLHYTKKAVNQLLHHKPPVPMAPHITNRSTVLGGHVLRKGTVVIPAIVESARSSGASTVYDPLRKDADSQFVTTLVFGAGQHKCPGRRYAESLLTVFFGLFLTEYDFERVGPRPDARDIMYYPTVFPAVNDFLLKRRFLSEKIEY